MTNQFECGESTIVTTDKGKVKGYAYRGLRIFKGIPYAKAKRFHAPEPVEAWEGVLDATSYGCVCPLLDVGRPSGELLVPHRYWVMDENCQNLNIWTPGCDDAKRPVMVWLHGGGFEAGSSIEQVAYEGENMSLQGQVVVVSINHRLNVLGYCDLSDFGEEYANSGNAGTDDIVAALKWIRENIGAFGGNPDNVTVFGQSGGGAKVTTLLQTPAADGLYARGINMSGVVGPALADAVGSGRELVEAMMQDLGISSVRELETVSYDRLAKSYKKIRDVLRPQGKYVGGCPHPNAYYAGEPVTKGFRKETAHIPLMVGSVFGEFGAFMPSRQDRSKMTEEDGIQAVTAVLGKEAAEEILTLFKKAYPDRHPVDVLLLDFIFRLPEMDYIRLRSGLNNCTWSYLFEQDFRIDGGRVAWHCSDIPYFFHNTELVPNTRMPGVEKLEEQIFKSVMAFAHTGNPNNDAIPEWKASTPEEEHTILFSGDTKVVTNHDRKLIPLVAKRMGSVFGRAMSSGEAEIQH
ncbi:MAG: carboxylesterase/lipase family protein [Subdoligranulum sp.]|nr:carboxylesterase/lipase family protein [Subdoligranulum sp.]